jgi:tetratricopeptide (TPR) repeat protein
MMKNMRQRHQPGRDTFSGAFRTCLTVLAATLAVAGNNPDTSNARNTAPLAMTDTNSALISQDSASIAPLIDSFLAEHPAKSLATETIGSQVIRIELAGSPKAAYAYAKKYDQIVSVISDILSKRCGSDVTGRKFMDRVWDKEVYDLHMNIGSPEPHYLSESLRTRLFDCQAFSILDFDIAKELGIRMKVITLPDHMLLRTEKFFFETTNGEYYPMKSIHDTYPLIKDTAAGPERFLACAYEDRGLAHAKLGKFRLAIDDCNKAIALDSTNANAYNIRGIAYAGLKELPLAMEEYNKAIALDPGYPSPYIQRAAAHYNMGKFRLAIDDCYAAISLDPAEPSSYTIREAAYWKLGEFEPANKDAGNLIALRPRDATAYWTRGETYTALGKFRLAVKDYSKALALNPASVSAYTSRGRVYYYTDRFQLAIEDCNKAIALDSADTAAYQLQGRIYDELGKFQLAIDYYDKVLALDPQNADARESRDDLVRKQLELQKKKDSCMSGSGTVPK